MSALIWVHDDAISRDHPVFARAANEHGDARAVFIFDPDYYRERGHSLKRIVFLLECLEDAKIEVLEGDFAQTLLNLNPDIIFVARTPNPHYRDVMDTLRTSTPVEVVKEAPFVRLSSEPDLKRFFRYWKKAKHAAMSLGGTEQ